MMNEIIFKYTRSSILTHFDIPNMKRFDTSRKTGQFWIWDIFSLMYNYGTLSGILFEINGIRIKTKDKFAYKSRHIDGRERGLMRFGGQHWTSVELCVAQNWLVIMCKYVISLFSVQYSKLIHEPQLVQLCIYILCTIYVKWIVVNIKYLFMYY